MPSSMTGFGRSRVNSPQGSVIVEIRSLNHKYLDINIKLPNGCCDFESRVKEQVGRLVKRGKISLFIICEYRNFNTQKLTADVQRAKQYYRALKKLNKELHLTAPVKLEQILLFPDVLKVEEKSPNYALLWPQIKQAVNKALFNLCRMRKKEGQTLCRDIGQRIVRIRAGVIKIKIRLPQVIERYSKRLEKRLKNIKTSIDRERFDADVALFAKNCDVTEEIIRMLSLLKSFSFALQKEKEIGKKLDFIAQELHREINTVGAKAQDADISQIVIKVKAEIEKIREQVQNIE
ncbi:MAG: YicC/YloC family endoribonuclease [Candidatus Omnitrophota bacterium]